MPDLELDPPPPRSWKSVREAWADGSWKTVLGGYGSGMWRERPVWYRVITRVSWLSHHVPERSRGAWEVLRSTDVDYGGEYWWRQRLVRAKGVLCCFVGRVDNYYPSYPEHKSSVELASWNARSWAGYEYTCWRADFAAVCLGWRNWHIHLYEEGE